jgi:glucose/arabinose dehydrogenase
VFVGTRQGSVYAIPDANRDGRAEAVRVIAEGLDEPNGVDVLGGALYVAEVSRIRRFDAIEEQLQKATPPTSRVVFTGLPDARGHQWRYLRAGPDGRLWIGIGAPCNVCRRDDPFASISRLAPEGNELEVWARGVRNSVGFDWQPGTGVLWFTDNGRDWLGDDRPPDELNVAPRAGMHFGFPHCQGGDVVDPDEGKGRACSEFVPPAAKLDPHVAALGMRFYRGSMFPREYRHTVFIAEHGSWNRSKPIGYRVTAVDVRGESAGNYRPFAEGWLQPDGAWGRPVDVLGLPDGSLLVSDDVQGSVYRITYRRR